MPTTPDPIAPADCRLLVGHPKLNAVLADYNAAVETARALLAKFPNAAVDPDVVATLDRLTTTRRSLTTPRFKVGFLGPFQCGKSTILNNLLGQEVSGVGVGKACTSVVTRLIVSPAGKPAEMALTYFTVDEYHARRNTLCDWIRLPNAAGTPESQLVEKLRSHNPTASGSANARRILPMDRPFLQAFLQSYIDHHQRFILAGPPHVERHPWTKELQSLLMHSQEQDGDDTVKPSKHLLVAESSITFPTDRIDPELELVDCPGLGSGRSVDDLLTREYIEELDGALLFLRAESMDSAEVGEIIAALQTRFRDTLRSRVWVVVNKMDAPEQHAKVGGDGKRTTFGVIAELMAKYKIPLSQVCLGCNGIFQLASAAGGTADRANALAAIKLFTPANDEKVKAQFDDMPDLAAAYEELLRDGGVSRLGRLIKEKVRPSVAEQILLETGAAAREARAELADTLKACEAPVSVQERKDTVAWENKLVVVLSQLSGGRLVGGWPVPRGPLFLKLEELGRAARRQLFDTFREGTPTDVLEQMTTADLFDRFEVDAPRMQDEVDAAFDSVVRDAYAEVTRQLEAPNLPPVALPGGKDPLALWADARQEDRQRGGWQERLRPRLAGDGFAARMRDDTLTYAFDGGAYQKLFEGKLRAAAQQIVLAVRGQLRTRLDAIRRQVRRKLGPAADRPAAPTPAAE